MSAVASSSGRVPQGEVIMDVSYIPPLGATNKEVELINQFADGGSYIKDKLESAVVELERKKITREEGQKASRAMEALNVNQTQLKPEDVDLICLEQGSQRGILEFRLLMDQVSQTGCSRTEAQEALKLNKGDLMTTLMKLVEPRQRARSVDGGGEKKS